MHCLIKILFVLSIFSCTSFVLTAQDFLVEGKKWNELDGYYVEKYDQNFYDNIIYIIKGDTLLDGITYKKIYSIDPLIGDTLLASNGNGDLFFLRENEEKQVFVRFESDSNDYLAYDFGVELFDEFKIVNILGCEWNIFVDFIYPYELETGDTVQAYDLIVRYGNSISELNTTWVEQIGDINGLLQTGMDGPCVFHQNHTMICCSINDSTFLYQKKSHPDCLHINPTLSTTLVSTSSVVMIEPNPTTQNIKITFSDLNRSFQSARLYACNGKFLGQFFDQSLNLESFPNGIYAILIEDQGGEKYVTKVVKN